MQALSPKAAEILRSHGEAPDSPSEGTSRNAKLAAAELLFWRPPPGATFELSRVTRAKGEAAAPPPTRVVRRRRSIRLEAMLAGNAVGIATASPGAVLLNHHEAFALDRHMQTIFDPARLGRVVEQPIADLSPPGIQPSSGRSSTTSTPTIVDPCTGMTGPFRTGCCSPINQTSSRSTCCTSQRRRSGILSATKGKIPIPVLL